MSTAAKLTVEPLDLIITGVGGQGNVLASQVLGRALLKAGYRVTVGETFGLSQRGGAVMSMVRVTHDKIMGPLIPEHRASAVVSLEPLEALRVLGAYGNPEVIVLTNDRPLLPVNVIAGASKYPDLNELKAALQELSAQLYMLPATTAALELGNPILANVIMLGALTACGLLPVGLPEIETALSEMFSEAKMPANRQALAKGAELMA
jgi:indolepyruvate ferredoxin oxidoreductase beta subunit